MTLLTCKECSVSRVLGQTPYRSCPYCGGEWTASAVDDPAVAEIRKALAEVQAMAVTLREQVGKADQLVLELTRASGEAQRYRHSIETIAQMLEDDADVAVYIAEVLRG